MDDPRVLRIITVGLVLAALAVVYFLLTGGIGVKSKKVQVQSNQTDQAVLSTTPSASAMPVAVINPSPSATPTLTTKSGAAIKRTQASVQALPNTGFPVGLAVVFSASAVVSGWSLRRYPN